MTATVYQSLIEEIESSGAKPFAAQHYVSKAAAIIASLNNDDVCAEFTRQLSHARSVDQPDREALLVTKGFLAGLVAVQQMH